MHIQKSIGYHGGVIAREPDTFIKGYHSLNRIHPQNLFFAWLKICEEDLLELFSLYD